MYRHLNVFNSPTSTNDEIINAGVVIFQFIYDAHDVDLLCKKAAAGVMLIIFPGKNRRYRQSGHVS